MAAQPKPLPVHQPSYLEGGGIVGWLTTIDHKRVAVMYLASALFFMAFGGLEAMAIRVQLWTPDNHALSAATYNAFFTMHGTTMIFLVVMPLLLGFLGNFLIPVADRRARRRVSAPQRVELLAGSGRRNPAASRLDSRRTARRGMVRLREPDRALLHARPRDRLVGGRPARVRHLDGAHRPELPDDDHRDARAGHDLHADADVHLVAAGDVDPHPDRISGAHHRADLSALRSFLRHSFLHRIRRRDADPVAASLLAVRPSRSVHHGAARLRHHLGSHPDLLAQAAVRLSDDGVFDLPDRVPVVRRVGTSHVRDRHGSGGGFGLRDHLDADRDSHRRENFQLDRDRLGRLAAHDHRILFRARHDPRIHHRRTQRNHARARRRSISSRPTPTSSSRIFTTCCSAA